MEREFKRLREQRVTSWSGVEMALREEATPGGAPQFTDPAVACLQLVALCATLGDGTLVTVGTYQDDVVWGLRLSEGPAPHPAHGDGIYRSRALPELPTGEVEDVSAVLDGAVLAEVVLRVGGRPLLLMAGEVYESPSDRLGLVRLDESVLVFTDPAAADSVDWAPPRR